ncbi:MAG: BTAD domain-containing putative transcriptional regulator [Sedimentisphaerales bacterium]|nr:BTAD domain-containing putative transcriptional regulator [Sedimentisphaerales bacterium]
MRQKHKNKRAAAAKRPDLAPLAMDSEATLDGLCHLLAGRRGLNPVEQAQQFIYLALEAPTDWQAVVLAKMALEVCPDCADAYNLLAELTADSPQQALDLYRKAVEAGKRALGPDIFKRDAGRFWAILETRPFMRALAGLAQCLWEVGMRQEAIEHYWQMLRLNPNDNQGIRDLLMPCLIEMGRDEDAERLFKQYEEDRLASWRYSRLLLDLRRHGDSPVTRKSLKAAIKSNRHVPEYLLGRRPMPDELPEYHSPGDENEAVLYVHNNKAAWQASPGASEWLAANCN